MPNSDSFVLSMNTNNIENNLHNIKTLFVFSNLIRDRELFSNKNKNVVGKFNTETLQIFGWTNFFV